MAQANPLENMSSSVYQSALNMAPKLIGIGLIVAAATLIFAGSHRAGQIFAGCLLAGCLALAAAKWTNWFQSAT